MSRKGDLDRFYDLLGELKQKIGGTRKLEECTGYMDWPDRSVYFFFSPDEHREESDQLRLTRVGTHAVSEGSGTTLWNRLRAHRGPNRGTYEGGGNHRGSVFRKQVGEAMLERDGTADEFSEWGEGSSASRETRLHELPHEWTVSEYVRELSFLWVEVEDEPGPESDRAYLERNAIALVSNFERETFDPRGNDWLGRHSPRRKIHNSGLWNVDHVGDEYDSAFLRRLRKYVDGTTLP